MAYLKTSKYPAAAPWGYEWPDGDTVVEVADEHAEQLLRIGGAGFREVLPGDPDHPGVTDQTDDEPTEPGEPVQPELEPDRTPIAEPDPDNYEQAKPATHRSRQRSR